MDLIYINFIFISGRVNVHFGVLKVLLHLICKCFVIKYTLNAIIFPVKITQ